MNIKSNRVAEYVQMFIAKAKILKDLINMDNLTLLLLDYDKIIKSYIYQRNCGKNKITSVPKLYKSTASFKFCMGL